MRFFANKIIIKAFAEDHVRGFYEPVQNFQDLHDFYAPKYTYDKNKTDVERQVESAKRDDLIKEYAAQVPEGLHPLLPGGWVPGKTEHNAPWSYDPHVMENTFGRLKHMSPTQGEMGMLSMIMRGWNRDSSDPGGQYLQLLANELGGRGAHEGIRSKRWSYDDGTHEADEKKAYEMREGFRNNPMHGRLKNLFGELSQQSQDDFREQYGDQGTVLHRGIGDDEDYISKIASRIDNKKPLYMNPLTSYSPRLRSAMKFAGFKGHRINDPGFYDQIKGAAGLPDDNYDFRTYHPQYPQFDDRANLHNLMSSRIRPEDVFLSNNIVGTPSSKDNAMKKENEIWVKPRHDIDHTLHRWAGWTTKPEYGSDKPYSGTAVPLEVHHTNEPTVDIPKIGAKIGHYHKPGHSDSMVNSNDMKVEPEPE